MLMDQSAWADQLGLGRLAKYGPISLRPAYKRIEDVKTRRQINTVKLAISEVFKVSGKTIMSRRKSRESVYPRFAIWWILKELTDLSFSHIAHHFNKRDHTTIIYGVKQVNEIWPEYFPDEYALTQTALELCKGRIQQ